MLAGYGHLLHMFFLPAVKVKRLNVKAGKKVRELLSLYMLKRRQSVLIIIIFS
jgi:hypothetical protein